MEISFLNNNKAIQPKQIQDQNNDTNRIVSSEENKKYVFKNKVDSTEISSSLSGNFEDKRIAVAKSAMLYEITVGSDNKVAELSQSITDGTYNVSADLLAKAILG